MYRVLQGLRAVRSEVREFWNNIKEFNSGFWGVLVINVLTSYAKQLFFSTIILLLTESYRYDDKSSTIILGISNALSSVYMLLTGAISDHYDIFIGLTASNLFTLLGIVFCMISGSQYMLVLSLVVFIPIGSSLGYSMAILSVTDFTDSPKLLSIGFALVHAGGQIPQLLALETIDIIRALNGHNQIVYELKIIQVCALASCILSLAFSLYRYTKGCRTFRCKILQDNPYDKNNQETGHMYTYAKLHPQGRYEPSWTDIVKILRKKSYWRQLALVAILGAVQTNTYVMDLLFPSYALRHYGITTPYGTISAINPLIVVLLAPLLQHFFERFSARSTLILGTTISTVGMFMPAYGLVSGSVLYFILTSVGESIWQPRMASEIMKYAEEQSKGTYNALVRVPNFAPQLAVSILGGFLLSTFCPGPNECNSLAFWSVLGGVAALTPVLLAVVWRTRLFEPVRSEDDEISVVMSDWTFIEDPRKHNIPVAQVESNDLSFSLDQKM
jgi:hypothetical protein